MRTFPYSTPMCTIVANVFFKLYMECLLLQLPSPSCPCLDSDQEEQRLQAFQEAPGVSPRVPAEEAGGSAASSPATRSAVSLLQPKAGVPLGSTIIPEHYSVSLTLYTRVAP